MLTLDEQQTALQIARGALEARVRREPPPELARGGTLEAPLGAFVTIHCGGSLRGCLGRVEVHLPLCETVADLAAIVSDSDPRFQAVSPEELPLVQIQISVLTPACEIGSIEDIEIGRHGLVIEQGFRRGLLLPQVASEGGWSLDVFLAHLCLKAGLPEDAWRDGARLLRFEAQVFSEPSWAGSL